MNTSVEVEILLWHCVPCDPCHISHTLAKCMLIKNLNKKNKNRVQLIFRANSEKTLQETFPLFNALSEACRSQPGVMSASGINSGSVVDDRWP